MGKLFFRVGRLCANSRSFLLADGSRFIFGSLFIILYALVLWTYGHQAGWGFSSPPYVNVPFLGNPWRWEKSEALTAIWLMAALWVGMVLVDRNRRRHR